MLDFEYKNGHLRYIQTGGRPRRYDGLFDWETFDNRNAFSKETFQKYYNLLSEDIEERDRIIDILRKKEIAMQRGTALLVKENETQRAEKEAQDAELKALRAENKALRETLEKSKVVIA